MSATGRKSSNMAEGDNFMECRACLQKIEPSTPCYNIFLAWGDAQEAPWPKLEGTIAANLARIARIQLTETDKQSKVMCQDCCLKLYSACLFISTVRKSNQILAQRSSEASTQNESDKRWPKPIPIDDVNGFVHNMEVEIKQEMVSDEEYGVGDEADKSDLMLDIKVEPEEIVDPLPIKVTVNGSISMDEMNAQGASVNGFEVYENVEYLDPPVKEEPMSEEDSEQTPDLPLDCLLCLKTFNSVSGLKAHVIAQHSYKTVRRKTDSKPSPEKKQKARHVCATCRRSFETSTDLMVHETCHNQWVCYGCNEKCVSFNVLTRHRRQCKASNKQKHEKPKTLQDVMRPSPDRSILREQELQCSMCPQKFSDRLYLTMHCDIQHSKEKLEKSESVESERRKNKDLEQKSYDKMETELENIFGDSEQTKEKEEPGTNTKHNESSHWTNKTDNKLGSSDNSHGNDEIKSDPRIKSELKDNLNAKLSLLANENATKTLESMLEEAVDKNGHYSKLIEIKVEESEYKMETELNVGDT